MAGPATALNPNQSSAPAAPDLAALKTKQQAAWSSGNYAIVGATLQIVGEELCEALDLKSGSKVLDVAAGNGMASLAAARRWCDVTSTDYVPALLERGRARAEAEGMEIEFREADAENLPFGANSFDTVLSTFGVMFTPNQDARAPSCCASASPGARSASPTGRRTDSSARCSRRSANICRRRPARNRRRCGAPARGSPKCSKPAPASIKAESRMFNFRYRSPEHFLEVFKTFYGPVLKAFAALDPAKQEELHNDLHALIVRMNRAKDGTMMVPSEYLEVIITKR